jgi:hypothetical protein
MMETDERMIKSERKVERRRLKEFDQAEFECKGRR